MDQPQCTPQEASPVSPLLAAAIGLHEQFLAYRSAGFTEEQSLSLIAKMVREARRD